MDVTSWEVTLIFSKPLISLTVWDGTNINCNANTCTFSNQQYNAIQASGQLLPVSFLMEFSEAPELVDLKINDMDACNNVSGTTTQVETTSTSTT